MVGYIVIAALVITLVCAVISSRIGSDADNDAAENSSDVASAPSQNYVSPYAWAYDPAATPELSELKEYIRDLMDDYELEELVGILKRFSRNKDEAIFFDGADYIGMPLPCLFDLADKDERFKDLYDRKKLETLDNFDIEYFYDDETRQALDDLDKEALARYAMSHHNSKVDEFLADSHFLRLKWEYTPYLTQLIQYAECAIKSSFDRA